MKSSKASSRKCHHCERNKKNESFTKELSSMQQKEIEQFVTQSPHIEYSSQFLICSPRGQTYLPRAIK